MDTLQDEGRSQAQKTTLDWAKEYVSLGFSVIPLAPRGKKPIIPWEEFQKQHPNPEELETWFGVTENNIGIVTGLISGLAVIDFDGREALEYRKRNNLAKTPFVRTGRENGYHGYYKYPEDKDVRNFQKRDDLPGIDLRANGGYVVAPPSIHESGARYHWLPGATLYNQSLAPLPDIILARTVADKTPLRELYNGVEEGERNNVLARLVGSWANDELGLEECLENAYLWNSKNNPPLPERELRATVKSIVDTHRRNNPHVHKMQQTVATGEPRVTEVTQSTEDTEVVQTQIKDSHIIPVTAFPFDFLPENFRSIVDSFSEALQVERELTASSMFAILSGAIGNTIKVSPKAGYEVAVFLWFMIIAASGYGKSPMISAQMQPIERLQGEEYRKYRTTMREYEACLMEAKSGKEVAIPDKPRLRHYFVSDSTVESLGNVYENDGRGVIIHQDELSGLILGLNQYKGKGNDRQQYLKLFNAGSWKIDRKSGVKFLQNTGAAIIGGIQTQIMPKVFGEDAFCDGLMPRFLLICTNNRPSKFSRKGISDSISSYWRALLGRAYTIPLIEDENGLITSKILILKESALQLWEEFYNEYNEIMPFLTDRAAVFIPKLTGYYSLKLAGVLHCLRMLIKPDGEIHRLIDEETVQGAINLTKFYAGQAIKALRLYQPQDTRLTEFQKRAIQTLYKLRDEVRQGKLSIATITDTFNQGLPKQVRHDRRQIGGILRGLTLTVAKHTNNLSFLTWEEERISKLFSQVDSVTTVTTVTNATCNNVYSNDQSYPACHDSHETELDADPIVEKAADIPDVEGEQWEY